MPLLGGDTMSTNIFRKYIDLIKEAEQLDEQPVQQGVAEGFTEDKQITWTTPNFDREYEEVEWQLEHGQGQIPKDVLDFYTKYFPNKEAWLRASQHGRSVVLRPDHGQKIRNYSNNKRDLLQALSPTSHDPEGPAKAQRVNALFDRGGPIEMPIILQTAKGLWLIGGKTRLGTANILKGLPAKVWIVSGQQDLNKDQEFAKQKPVKEKGVAEAIPTIRGTPKAQPGADYTGEDLVRDANALFTAGGFKLADKEVEPRVDNPKKINTTYYWRKKIKGLTPDQGQVQQLMIEIYNYAPNRTYWAINDWANDGARVTSDLAQKLWRRMEKTIKDSIDTAEQENYWYSMTGNGKTKKVKEQGVAEESLEEAGTPDAVRRIEQLVQYK